MATGLYAGKLDAIANGQDLPVTVGKPGHLQAWWGGGDTKSAARGVSLAQKITNRLSPKVLVPALSSLMPARSSRPRGSGDMLTSGNRIRMKRVESGVLAVLTRDQDPVSGCLLDSHC